MANAFYAARVWETGTLTATATVITLPNTAASISGDAAYQTFASAAPPTGSPVVATVAATTTGGAWEQSVWTYTSGSPGTLTRLTFLSSSTGAAINWSGVAASIMLDVPPPIVASAGAASAGLVPALGATGVLDASVVPPSSPGAPYGYAVPGLPFIINDTFWRGQENYTFASGTLIRFAMAWKYPFTPTYIGVLPDTGVAGAICRLGVYSLLTTGEAGTLLYDSGDLAPTSATTPAFGPTVFSGTLAPGTYIFDILIGATAPNLFIEQAASNSPAVSPAAFYGGISGLYYQYPVLVALQTGVAYGAMPTTAPANSNFSGQNSTFPEGSRPIIVAQR